MFYKISKLFMDLDLVMRHQEQLKEMEEQYDI